MDRMVRLHQAFRKFYEGEHLDDDDIVLMIDYIDPIIRNSWVLDPRFGLFVETLQEMSKKLRSYMNARLLNNKWAPTPATEPAHPPRFMNVEKRDDSDRT